MLNANDNKPIDTGPKFSFDFSKDKLALLVGGMAVLALVFATYNFFNRGADISSSNTEREEDKIVLKSDKTNGTTANDKKPTTGGSVFANKGETLNQGTAQTGSAWVANNYNKGDITGGSYTVKRGDTLWEIAEAAYGDGTQWTKILEANKADIGFLPSGRQALIVTGQTLVLP